MIKVYHRDIFAKVLNLEKVALLIYGSFNSK